MVAIRLYWGGVVLSSVGGDKTKVRIYGIRSFSGD